ncbi:hypothetical protein AUJ15_03535 [Candidatus Micrarchaeota archaeon CG1_02_55_41]|nr:MAG: hypothetical protein AUJ15_03535 [Candidatus Micrarchaeota archaeon CG1_02_55_41]
MRKRILFLVLLVACIAAAPQDFFNPSNTTAWGNEHRITSFTLFAVDGAAEKKKIDYFFTPDASGTPYSAWLWANRSGGGSFDLNVSLEGDDGSGFPNGVALCSNGTTVAAAAFAWYNISLPGCVALTAGQKYHLVINYSNAFLGSYPNLRYTTPDLSAGSGFASTDGAVWTPVANSEPIFVLELDTGYYGPGYTAVHDNFVRGNNYVGEYFTAAEDAIFSSLNISGILYGIGLSDHLYYNVSYANDTAILSGKLIDSGIGVVSNRETWHSANFSRPFTARAGESYRVYISSPGAGLPDYSIYSLNTTNAAPLDAAGNFNSTSANLSLYNGAAWTENGSADLSFQLDYAECYPAGAGAWIVDSVEYCEDQSITLSANLSVLSGGYLTLKNATLYLNNPVAVPANASRNATIYSGGTLVVRDNDNNPATWNDASLLTAALSGNPDTLSYFVFNVESGAFLEFKNSELSQAGYALSETGPIVGFVPYQPAGLRIASNWSNVTDNRIHDCFTGTLLYEASHCNVSGNTYWNVDVDSSAVTIRVLNSSDHNEFSYNSMNQSNSYQFYVANASYNNFSRNTVWGAASDGFHFKYQANNNSLWYNNVSHNSGAGIQVRYNSDNVSIYWSNVSYNNDYGLRYTDKGTSPGEVANNNFSYTSGGGGAGAFGVYSDKWFSFGVSNNWFIGQSTGFKLDLSGLGAFPTGTLRFYNNVAFNNSYGFVFLDLQNLNYSYNNASYDEVGAYFSEISNSVIQNNTFGGNLGNSNYASALVLIDANNTNVSYSSVTTNLGSYASVAFYQNTRDSYNNTFAYNNVTLGVGGSGLAFYDYLVKAKSFYGCNVSYNNFSYNAFYGLLLDSYFKDSWVQGNVFQMNSEGLLLKSSAPGANSGSVLQANNYSSNTFYANTLNGVNSTNHGGDTFFDNNASYNGLHGFYLLDAADPVQNFSHNRVSHNYYGALFSLDANNVSFNNYSYNDDHGAYLNYATSFAWNNTYQNNSRGFICNHSILYADNETALNNSMEGFYHESCNSSFTNSNASNNTGYGALLLDSYTNLNSSGFGSTNFNKSLIAWTARVRTVDQLGIPLAGSAVTVWVDSVTATRASYNYSNYSQIIASYSTDNQGYTNYFYVYDNVSANDGSDYLFQPDYYYASNPQTLAAVSATVGVSRPLTLVLLTLYKDWGGGGEPSPPSEQEEQAEEKPEEIEGSGGPQPTPSPTPSPQPSPEMLPVNGAMISGDAVFCTQSQDGQIIEITRTVLVLREDNGAVRTEVFLLVKNLGTKSVTDFMLYEDLPDGSQLSDFSFALKPDFSNESVVGWLLRVLAPGQEVVIYYFAEKEFAPDAFKAPPQTILAQLNPLVYLLVAEMFFGAAYITYKRLKKPPLKKTGKPGYSSQQT